MQQTFLPATCKQLVSAGSCTDPGCGCRMQMGSAPGTTSCSEEQQQFFNRWQPLSDGNISCATQDCIDLTTDPKILDYCMTSGYK